MSKSFYIWYVAWSSGHNKFCSESGHMVKRGCAQGAIVTIPLGHKWVPYNTPLVCTLLYLWISFNETLSKWIMVLKGDAGSKQGQLLEKTLWTLKRLSLWLNLKVNRIHKLSLFIKNIDWKLFPNKVKNLNCSRLLHCHLWREAKTHFALSYCVLYLNWNVAGLFQQNQWCEYIKNKQYAIKCNSFYIFLHL